MGWTASDFERLDPRLFRSFLAVVKTQSFSAGACAASLTQGAVSQQIAKLEDRLNTQLFVRAGNKVVMTPAGQLLAQYAQAYMEHATSFLEQLNVEFESMRGLVRYAMPESCIHSPHFGWLLKQRLAHPDIVLGIELKPSGDVLDDVLSGGIDFGFVNRQSRLPTIQSYPFCFEEYVLVQASSAQPVPLLRSLDELLDLPMIVYPDMVDHLNRWITVRFAETDPITPLALRITGDFNDMRGAVAMVEGGLGCSVLPRHVVEPSIHAGRLHQILAHGVEVEAEAVRQQVWIIRLKDRKMPARVRRVIGWFLDMHTELQPIPLEFMQ